MHAQIRTPVAPDTALVERMAAVGDREALNELWARHGMTLYALAYGVLFDPDEAGEAVMLAFNDAWCDVSSFDANRWTVTAWLSTLTRARARQLFVTRPRRTPVAWFSSLEQRVLLQAGSPSG